MKELYDMVSSAVRLKMMYSCDGYDYQAQDNVPAGKI